MERSEIEKIVKDIVVEKLKVDPSQIKESSSFVDDLGADSLDTVELIMDFDQKFNVEIPDEDAEKIRTVGDAIKYLEEKTKK
jgi:acyl carrier protein